jgi:hypothetical protein
MKMSSKSEGWRNKRPDDPKRHSDAARGIESGHKGDFEKPSYPHISKSRTIIEPPMKTKDGDVLSLSTPTKYVWKAQKGDKFSPYVLKKIPLPAEFFEEYNLPFKELWELDSYMPLGMGGYNGLGCMGSGNWFFTSKEDAFYHLKKGADNFKTAAGSNEFDENKELGKSIPNSLFGSQIRDYLSKHPDVKERLHEWSQESG